MLEFFNSFILVFVLIQLSIENVHCRRTLRIGKGHQDDFFHIRYDAKLGEGFCTGSIIGNNFILTAAHCVVSQDENNEIRKEDLLVTVGIPFPGSDKCIRRLVERIYVPSEYNGTHTYRANGDIAVLKLYDPLGIGEDPRIEKLDLPVKEYESYEGITAKVSGFGATEVEHVEAMDVDDAIDTPDVLVKHYPSTLQWESAVVLNQEQCELYLKVVMAITDPDRKRMCARLVVHDNDNKGVCNGDSGGPLEFAKTILGVVSFGKADCNEATDGGSPAVYTRVSEYTDFIQKAMKDTPFLDNEGMRVRFLGPRSADNDLLLQEDLIERQNYMLRAQNTYAQALNAIG